MQKKKDFFFIFVFTNMPSPSNNNVYEECPSCGKEYRVHKDPKRPEKSCKSNLCRGIRQKCARDFTECLDEVEGLFKDNNLPFTHFMIGDNVDGLEMLISKIDKCEKNPFVDSWKLKGNILRRTFSDVKDCKSLIMGIAMAQNFTEENGKLKMMRRAMKEIENILRRVEEKSCFRRVMLPIIKEHFDALMGELENLKVLQATIEKTIRQECPENKNIIDTLSHAEEQAKENLRQHKAKRHELLEEKKRLMELLKQTEESIGQINESISKDHTLIDHIKSDKEDVYDQYLEE